MLNSTLVESLREQFPVQVYPARNDYIDRLRVVADTLLVEHEVWDLVQRVWADGWLVEHTYWTIEQGGLKVTELGFVRVRTHDIG